MAKLVKDEETVMYSLSYILQCYENYRTILKMKPKEALEKTLIQYDDFHEWLQDKI